MKIPNQPASSSCGGVSLARIVSEDSQLVADKDAFVNKSSKDS